MREQEIRKVVRQLNQADIDAVLICPSNELRLYMGFSPMMCERFQGLFITGKGEMFYVCNRLYTFEIVHEYGAALKVYTWEDGDDMAETVYNALEEHTLIGGTIAVNATAQGFHMLNITRRCNVTFVDGVGMLEEARIIKTQEEIDNLRYSAHIVDDIFAKALKIIHPGMREGDILAFLKEELAAAGGESIWGTVASGPNSSFGHYQGEERVIEEKDIIILDYGCTWKGMYSDMTRTVFVGEPTEKQRMIYDLVRKANEASEKAAVTGAFIPDVDAAARNVVVNAGFKENYVCRTGHGIGYLIHESPNIHKGTRRRLEPGMAFSIEPGVYLPNEFGVRIEDILVATETGNEVLNRATKEMIVL